MVEDIAIKALNYIAIQRPRSEYFRLDRRMENASESEINAMVQFLLLNHQNYTANVRVLS